MNEDSHHEMDDTQLCIMCGASSSEPCNRDAGKQCAWPFGRREHLAWNEHDRIESLISMRTETARQTAAENARCARLLDAAGFGEAAAFLRVQTPAS